LFIASISPEEKPFLFVHFSVREKGRTKRVVTQKLLITFSMQIVHLLKVRLKKPKKTFFANLFFFGQSIRLVQKLGGGRKKSRPVLP
jgi:hypothetical protein